MSLRRKGLVLAMESEEEVVVEPVEVDDTALMEMEEASEEVEGQSDDVEEINDAIEDAAEDGETLERIKDTMEDSLEEGEGLSESAAEIAEVAIESICARLGIQNTNVMPAMESFGSTSSRAAATRVAIESIGDKIETVWKAVKQAVINAWEKITLFISGLLKNVKAIDEYNAKLIEAVNGLSGDVTKTEQDTEKGGLIKAVSVDSTADVASVTKLLDNAISLLSFTEYLIKEMSINAKHVLSVSDYDGVVSNAIAGIKKTIPDSLTVETNDDTVVIGPFVGGKTLTLTLKGSEKVLKLDLASTTIDKDPAKKMSYADKAEVKVLLDKNKELIAALTDFKKTEKDSAKVKTIILKAADDVIKAASKVEDEDKATSMKELRASVSSVSGFTTKTVSKAPSIAFATAKTVDKYAAACLANLKVAETK